MGPGCKIYALKRIKLAGRDEEAASGFIDEINLLNSLKDKPNIIQLVESQVRPANLTGQGGRGKGGCTCVLYRSLWTRWLATPLDCCQHRQGRVATAAALGMCATPAVCVSVCDSQVFTEEGLIYMVQEYGEIDLARLLAKHAAARKEAGALRDNIDENFIRLYWQQMLQVRAGQ